MTLHVVVLDERMPERDTIARTVERLSYTVHTASDNSSLMTALTEYKPGVVILAWRAGCNANMVRATCATSPRAYVIAVVDGGNDIAAMLAAGAHDVLRRPIIAEELNARIETPRRLRDYIDATEEQGPDVRALAAWRTLGDLVAHDLGKMFGTTLVTTETWPRVLSGLRTATIPMSLAAHELELRVSVVTDAPGMQWLATTLLGASSADESTLLDILRELANTAGGAVKRAACLEDVELTTGLPVNDQSVADPNGDKIRGWVLSTTQGFLAVHAEIRRHVNRRVAAAKLAEGMVLVRDLRNAEGALLVAAGTRLTSTTAVHVARILGERFVVDVAA